MRYLIQDYPDFYKKLGYDFSQAELIAKAKEDKANEIMAEVEKMRAARALEIAKALGVKAENPEMILDKDGCCFLGIRV